MRVKSMDAQEERVPSLFSVPLVLFFVGVFLFIALLNGQRDLALWAILVIGESFRAYVPFIGRPGQGLPG